MQSLHIKATRGAEPTTIFDFVCNLKYIYKSLTYIFLKEFQNKVLEFVQTVINSGTTHFFHERFLSLEKTIKTISKEP